MEETKSLPNREEVLEALHPIIDPELNLSIVDLGLIYDAEPHPDKEQALLVKMTLTSPACPVGPQLMGAVHATCLQMENVEDVDIQLVWTPPWDPRTMATEDVRMMLGIWE